MTQPKANAPLPKFEIFVATAPGHEKPLAAEIAENGFKKPKNLIEQFKKMDEFLAPFRDPQ